VWLDKDSLKGVAEWTNEIEAGLEASGAMAQR
jgi:hypothetical protein